MEHLKGLSSSIVDIHHFRTRFYNCNLHRSPRDLAHRFHEFPKIQHWHFDESSGTLTPEAQYDDQLVDLARQKDQRTRFVQHWLFFELLREVFLEDSNFDYQDFITPDQYIKTDLLQVLLGRWEEREQDEIWAEGRTPRMIRIHQALELARTLASEYISVTSTRNLDRIGDPVWPINEAVANSIMVLGEALTRSLIRIQTDPHVSFCLNGWSSPSIDGQGWGYSQMVLERFKKHKWCPKTVRMLEKLMRGNTIGLLLALSYPLDSGYHVSCSDAECKSQITKAKYEALEKLDQSEVEGQETQLALIYNASRATLFPTPLRHAQDCRPESSTCHLTGPEEEKLIKLLEGGRIPLFHYNTDTGKVEVEYMASFRPAHLKEYTVFSHVWTDGFGNHDANEMHSCVLQFLTELCDIVNHQDSQGKVVSGQYTRVRRLFWIDTLALPAKRVYSDQRSRAIGQIHDIYRYATHTVVLDGGLMEDPVTNYAGTAMKITMSRWMTRLWTLQEAVLSKNIFFNFSDRPISLDQIESHLGIEDQDFHKCISEAARTYYQGILGSERRIVRTDQVGKNGGPALVASVWRAVQWRGAAFRHHETLALAILLGGPVEKFAELSSTTVPALEKKEEYMQKLIEHLADRNPCAIPAGMIFLPGEKLSAPGFRWAPRSWLTAAEVLSPDPLALHQQQKRTQLLRGGAGLLVRYPGFKLHAMSDSLDQLFSADSFHFPVSWELENWYLVSWPKDREQYRKKATVGKRQLAIITMFLPISPKEQSGLLVAIKKTGGNGILEVDTISRVFLSRERKETSLNNCKTTFKTYKSDAIPCGEELSPKQQWCVDGPDALSLGTDRSLDGGLTTVTPDLGMNEVASKTLNDAKDNEKGSEEGELDESDLTERGRGERELQGIRGFIRSQTAKLLPDNHQKKKKGKRSLTWK